VSAIGYLDGSGTCAGDAVAVTTAPVACDIADPWLARQPVLYRGGLTIGQTIDDTATVEVADHCSIAVTKLPRPVISSNDRWGEEPTNPQTDVVPFGQAYRHSPAGIGGQPVRPPAAPPSAKPIWR
jgi:hypothetical protein